MNQAVCDSWLVLWLMPASAAGRLVRGFVSVAVRMPGVAGVEGCSAVLACLVDSAFVDGVRSVVVQAAVTVVGVVVREVGAMYSRACWRSWNRRGKSRSYYTVLNRDSE
jgi:hypothetical protein